MDSYGGSKRGDIVVHDYKSELTIYMKGDNFTEWCAQATLAQNQLLKLLNIATFD